MHTRDEIARQLDRLNQEELEQVSDYLAFLKYRSRKIVAPFVDEAQVAALYGEFAEEDRELAEAGIAEYAEGLVKEDAQ